MEIRNIQQTGGSTHTVSLPRQWANQVGVTSGMNVGITTRSCSTLFTDTSSPFFALSLMDVTGKPGKVVVREIIASYIAGFNNSIEIRSNRITAGQKQIIREITHKLIGPEIIEKIADIHGAPPLYISEMCDKAGQSANDLAEIAVYSLFSCGIELAHIAIRMKDKVHNILRVIECSCLDAENALHLGIIADRDRIGDCGANIAEIAIHSIISKSV